MSIVGARGRPKKLTVAALQEAVRALRREGMIRPNARLLAGRCGVSRATIYRLGRQANLRFRQSGPRLKPPCCMSCGYHLQVPKRQFPTWEQPASRSHRRLHWRCPRCRRSVRKGTIFYRRQWCDSAVAVAAHFIRRTPLEERGAIFTALTQELNVSRKTLYSWWKTLRRGHMVLPYASKAEWEAVNAEVAMLIRRVEITAKPLLDELPGFLRGEARRIARRRRKRHRARRRDRAKAITEGAAVGKNRH